MKVGFSKLIVLSVAYVRVVELSWVELGYDYEACYGLPLETWAQVLHLSRLVADAAAASCVLCT